MVEFLGNKYKIQTEEIKIEQLKHSMIIWSANMKTVIKLGNLIIKTSNIVNICKELFKSIFGCSHNSITALVLALWDYREPEVGSEKYNHYLRLCNDLEKTLKNILGDNGVLFYPAHPTAAPYHNETWLRACNISNTTIINCVGLPCTTIPLGFNKEGLPIGIQVIANYNNDKLYLAIAEELDKAYGEWREPHK